MQAHMFTRRPTHGNVHLPRMGMRVGKKIKRREGSGVERTQARERARDDGVGEEEGVREGVKCARANGPSSVFSGRRASSPLVFGRCAYGALADGDSRLPGVAMRMFMPPMRSASSAASFPPMTRPADKSCFCPTTRSTSKICSASSRVGEITTAPSPDMRHQC
eukprot:3717339-Pleurochrysis_carterae.AAC.3